RIVFISLIPILERLLSHHSTKLVSSKDLNIGSRSFHKNNIYDEAEDAVRIDLAGRFAIQYFSREELLKIHTGGD
ncbi:unnamed protein product, partial [Brassica oleracea]